MQVVFSIKTYQTYQRQNKDGKKQKIRNKGKRSTVGTISMINDTGFIIEVKHFKTKVVSSADVKVDSSTVYRKNGMKVGISDLVVGKKVIVIGNLDKTTNIIAAKKVIIVIK